MSLSTANRPVIQLWKLEGKTARCFVFVLAAPRGMRDLSSPTRDRTWEAGSLNHWEGKPGKSQDDPMKADFQMVSGKDLRF